MLQSFVMLSVDKHISVGIVAVAVACMVFLCKALLALNSLLLQDHVGCNKGCGGNGGRCQSRIVFVAME